MSQDFDLLSDDEEAFLHNEAQEHHEKKVSDWFNAVNRYFHMLGIESSVAKTYQEITSTKLQQIARLCAENSPKLAAYHEKLSLNMQTSEKKLHSMEAFEEESFKNKTCKDKDSRKKVFSLEDTARCSFEMACNLKATIVERVEPILSKAEIGELENTIEKLIETSSQLIEAAKKLVDTSHKLTHANSLVEAAVIFKNTAQLCQETASQYNCVVLLEKQLNIVNDKIREYFDDESTTKFMLACDGIFLD